MFMNRDRHVDLLEIQLRVSGVVVAWAAPLPWDEDQRAWATWGTHSHTDWAGSDPQFKPQKHIVVHCLIERARFASI